MLGTYDFCGYYEWTFAWMTREGGHAMVREYWAEAISRDSQLHARELILGKGFEGMIEYWGHTLLEESPSQGYTMTHRPGMIRFDMQDCPSKGFLLRNGLEQYPDYCDHCMGWIGPLLREGKFTIDHEHNHCGQCWWEIRAESDSTPPSAPGALYEKDARLMPEWNPGGTAKIDRYRRSTDPDDKTTP